MDNAEYRRQVAAGKRSFEAQWNKRVPGEPLPVNWDRDFMTVAGASVSAFTLPDLPGMMDTAGQRELEPGKTTSINPRWRYFLGILRNKGADDKKITPVPAPAPYSGPDPLFVQLVELTSVMERIAAALERIADQGEHHEP